MKGKIPGGLGARRNPSDFDSAQLEKGVRIEMEHTTDPVIAREIAMDHLTEDSEYYVKLERMEKRVASRYLEKRGMEFPTEEALKKYLEEHPGADKSRHEVVEKKKDSPDDFDGSSEWGEAHTAVTPGGSSVLGLPHWSFEGDDEGAEKEYIEKKIIPAAVVAAKEAIKAGKKVVFLAEGMAGGIPGSEQERVAKALDEKAGGKVKQDTWDDDAVKYTGWSEEKGDFVDPDSPHVRKLAEEFGGIPIVVAAFYAGDMGQPDTELHGTDEIADQLREWGIDPDDQRSMYLAAFPEDAESDEDRKLLAKQKNNPVKDIYAANNGLRQKNLMKKIKDVEADGGVAIVTPGYSHASDLKPELEGRGKKAVVSPCRREFSDPERCFVPWNVHVRDLGEIPPWRIWTVRAGTIRDHIDQEFTSGGNPARYGYVPEDEIWIEDSDDAKDLAGTLLHEIVETWLMINRGLSYDEAHDEANVAEHWFRTDGLIVAEIDHVVPVVRTEFMAWRVANRHLVACRVAAKYKSKKKIKTKDGDEAIVYEYSDRQVQNRNRVKAERVEKLRHSLNDLQKQVKKDLKSDDFKIRMCALAVGLINDTYERVGNEDSAEDGHYGVTGWQKGHVSFGKGKATIRYVGKSGVDHEKYTDDAGLIRVLKEAVKGKGDDDPVFETEDFTVGPGEVNAYLEDFDITAKDIRGLHANRIMQEKLREARKGGGKLPAEKKEREKALKEEFKAALEETAEEVGHEAATLKKQYLVPGIEDNYLRDGTVKDNLAKQG